ncbi:MAG: membrane protein [Sphaerobacter sp.]|nr:membrane protein [Sphaerobacter sp.]
MAQGEREARRRGGPGSERSPWFATPPPLRAVRRWGVAEWRRWLVHLAVLIAGLALFALGLVLSLQSNLGANSWTVFHDGLARRTPLTIGQASQLVGFLMIAASWLVGVRPGVGTVLNMYLVGLFMDVILAHDWVPLAQAYPARVAMLLASVAVLGLATGIYIRAGFGAGPRDSFNLALVAVTRRSVGTVRWLVEGSAVVIGIVLGGDFGVGTILATLLMGPAVDIGFRLTGLAPTGTPRRAVDRQQDEPAPIIDEVETASD